MIFTRTDADADRLGTAPTEPAPADPNDEGIHPALASLVDLQVKPLAVHLRKRGAFQAECGSYEGAIVAMPVGITCPECRRSRRVKK